MRPLARPKEMESPGLVNDVVGGWQQRAMQRDDISLLQKLLLGQICHAQLLELLILIEIMCDYFCSKALHSTDHSRIPLTSLYKGTDIKSA